MSISSRVLGRMMGLPAATSRARRETKLAIPMPDGVVLGALRWSPEGVERAPLILVRSPYGIDNVVGVAMGEVFAERGYQVLLVSARGTFASQGQFHPFHQEKADGLATLAWMREQRWYPGSFGTMGPSYLGLVQWAIAAEAPDLRAMAVHISASEFQSHTYPGGTFALDTGLTWSRLIAHQEHQNLLTRMLSDVFDGPLRRAYLHLPLTEADRVASGKTAPFFQDWLRHDAAGDPWWNTANFDREVPRVNAAVMLTGGWYDIFVPWQLADYQRLVKAGRPPRLIIGPWEHPNMPGMGTHLREAFAFFERELAGRSTAAPGAPVRIFVTGEQAWRELPAWPPPTRAESFHLESQGKLVRGAPSASAASHYRYDPADPTPAVGGPTLSGKGGPKDNRVLERRADVLTFTGPELSEDLEVIGTPEAELFVRSSAGHADFFVRLCDVEPDGKSINVCDGIQRIQPEHPAPDAEGVVKIRFTLWPTAHRFRAGHRVRVQVSSGAHPRFARNLGAGEPLATGTRLVVAEQQVFHDPAHPSHLVLPVSAP